MTQVSNIIKGISKICKFSCEKILNNKHVDSQHFVTREEYETLKQFVLHVRSDVENLNKKYGKHKGSN